MSRCLQCQYDLRGSTPDGRCPECGYPVALSLRGVHPHGRLRALARKVSAPFLAGFTLYGLGTIFSAIAGEPFYRYADWRHLFGYVILPTAALVLWAGWAAAVATLVWRGVLRWWWVVPLAWSVIAALLLMAGMEAYVSDIIEMGTWENVP